MHRTDVLIIGGGPAGSTVGSLIKKYRPDLKVMLLEQAVFPRHHIGESLLAAATPVLKELQVYDKIAGAGFPEKLGATYVWGHGNQPWGFEFQEIDGQLRRDGVSLGKEYFRGWQVTRSRYDHILLNHAAEFGVEVVQGARVTGICCESEARRGVTYVHHGAEHEIAAELIVDASGQNAVMGRKLGLQEWDARLKNVAVYGYWEGAKWKFQYAGYPNITRILICTTPHGWIWYIPVKRETISVGWVLPAELARSLGDIREVYFRQLKDCPEIADLLEHARLVRVGPEQKTDLLTERDWSFTCSRMAGDGWLLVGDAAGFVDPILSSGVLLAHQNGQKAAYTINTILGGAGAQEPRAYLDFYEATYRVMLTAYREMASFWYGNNFSRDGWFWESWRQLAAANQEHSLTSREAFMRLASGYANRTESFALFGSYTPREAQFVAEHLFGQASPSGQQIIDRSRPFSLAPHAEIGTGFFYYRGAVWRTQRVANRETRRYLDLFPAEVESLDWLRRGCSFEQLPVEGRGHRTREQLLFQLHEIGVLEYGAQAAGAGG